jgi:hypothetical protein
MEATAKRETISPPYVPWKTFKGFIERMEPPNIVPTQIDSTIVKTYAGSVQRLLLQSLRWLELIEPDGKVRDDLKDLVNLKAERPRLIRQLLERRYPWALSLDGNSTELQLNAAFGENTGAEGDTRRKAIAFFLAAADYAKVQHSPLWKKSRGRPVGAASSSAGRRPLVRRTRTGEDKGASQTPDPPTAGDEITVKLQAGGSVTLRVNVGHFALSRNKKDRDFVQSLMDALTSYEEGRSD